MTRQLRLGALALLAVSSCFAAWPQDAEAQRRAVRRTAARRVVVLAPGFYSPHFYRPFFYRPFYGGFYHPLTFGWYGQYPYPPYGYRFPVYDRTGSARLQVTPRETEVYVDGYFVGIVDDYDGTFQRLHVEAGEHELQLHLEGYRAFTQKVRFTPGTTLRIAHAMEPLPPGEAPAPKPQPDPAMRAGAEAGPRPSRQYGRAQASLFGTLSLRVQPEGASVVIDGEEWERPEGESRFVVDLGEGPHRLEVRQDGYQPYVRTIQIRRSQTLTLNVSLTAGGRAALTEGGQLRR